MEGNKKNVIVEMKFPVEELESQGGDISMKVE